MKKYKNAKSTKVFRCEYTAVRYEYICPFCHTQHINYSLDEDVVRLRCGECKNEIILKWQ